MPSIEDSKSQLETAPHRTGLRLSTTLRRVIARALVLGAAVFGAPSQGIFSAGQQTVGQQTVGQQTTPGTNCVATLENRSALVDQFGTFTIPNVPVDPVNPALYRVRVTCPQPDGSVLGSISDYQNLANGSVSIPNLPLGILAPQNSSLQINVVSGGLTAVGSTAQLNVIATTPQGTPSDATLYSEGTTYSTSNAAVATVNANGLVTATGPGNVTITARNDGLASTIVVSSFALLDSDGDGMPDVYEIANGLNPYDPTDAALDPDGDGLTNLQEYQLGTNPHIADTDGDGLSDGQEVALGTNPLVADTDSDGLSDGQEVALGTNPLVADTDGDGIPDGVEVKIGTNPLVADVTTTVTGYVTNADGTPHPGASVVVLTYFTTTTDLTGAFTLLHVPITLGNFIVSAEAVVGTSVLSGASPSTAGVGNGITNAGTIQLGQNAGQVTGRVTTPDNVPDPGVQVTVVDGNDTRTAITDGNGLFVASGLQSGAVSVSAIDPATSLRGQASGVLSPGGPLTLNVKLAAFGTVSGYVTSVNGTNVGAGVTVTISGALSASTTTDQLGHYSFSFVPLGRVTVDASDANGNHGRTTGLITATAQSITANVQYLGRGTVTGVVSNGTGTPVPGATVMLSNNGQFNQALTTTTNSVGQYTLSSVFVGALNLSAYLASNSTGGATTSAITSDGQTVTANIILTPTATISGTVYQADGATPLAGANITIPYSALTATSAANGTFTIANLPLQTYTVNAADPATGNMGTTKATLTTAGSTVPVTITMDGIGNVNVTVVDGSGNPAANAQVTVTTGQPFYSVQTGVTTAGGTVSITQQLAGSLNIAATSSALGVGGSTSATLTANGTLNVTVTLQSTGTVQGAVYQLDGKTPVAGATVLVNATNQSVQTSAAGAYSIVNVPTGTYRLSVLDSLGNTLATNNSVTLGSEGQVVTANFVIIGRGTVIGQVTNPDGSPAPGIAVTVTSFTANDPHPFGTQTDANGNYSVAHVPMGTYSVVAQSHTVTTNSYGTANGAVTSDGSTSVTNVQLSSSLVPTTLQLYDANQQSYPIRENGALNPGGFNIFAGDGSFNIGGSVLSIVQNGTATPFVGEEFAPVNLNGRQISIEQDGLDGLNIVRRVFVPGDGYFARYVDLISNPGTQPITVGVQFTSNFRNIVKITQLATYQSETVDPPHILLTSSGDTILNVTDPNSPDRWVTFGGPIDDDPFLVTSYRGGSPVYNPMPPVADVFDGPGGTLAPSSASFAQDPSGNFSALIYTYNSVTIPAGGTVGLMHFLTEENHFAGANATAARLVQLPPEALAGLTPSDLSSIANFAVPGGGNSTVAPLPTLLGQEAGYVYASNQTTPVTGAGVAFQSTDPIFGRLYTTSTASDGSFSFVGSFQGLAIPTENFNVYATHAQTGTISPTFTGSFGSNNAVATQNIYFNNTGIITGTVSQGPTVVNTAGTVSVTGGNFTAPAVVAIQADGTYTLTGVLPGTYIVTAQITNTLLTGSTTATVTALQTTTANISIGTSGSIVGTVTRADNSLAVNDIVNLRLPKQNPLTALIDTSGHYVFSAIPTGTYTIDCYDPQSNSAASATVAVANNSITTQNLVLQNTSVVSGNVSANDGSSVVGLTVNLTSTTSTGTQTLASTTSASGGFSFTNVMPGTIVVRVTNAEGLQGTGNGSVPIAGQTITVNVALIAAGNLTGTVYQGDGTTPAAGIQVTLSPAPLTGSAVTTTNASGVYNFSNVSFGNFTVYAANLANGDRGQAGGQVQVNGQLRTINVNLNGFGNLTVHAVDVNNNPIPSAAITVQNTSIGATYNAIADATGTAVFTNIFAGTFSLTAKNPANGLGVQTSGTLAYHANQSITVTLQAYGAIAGVVYQPDGVTPAAGATVQWNPPYGGSTTTDAYGNYSFPNLVLSFYSLAARDKAGVTRAVVPTFQLQTSGVTVTQNLTFQGVGSVTGTVTNTDGTPAENFGLTVTSGNPTIGGISYLSTGGDGTYSIPEIALGGFTIAVNNLPANLSGYATGSLTSNGQALVVNIQIVASAVTLPLTLTDADGFTYTIASDGDYGPTGSYGKLSPFFDAQGLTLNVNGGTAQFGVGGDPTTALQSLNGQQVEINEGTILGLDVTRKIYVPTNGYFARRLDVLTNNSSSPVTVGVTEGGSIERYTSNYPGVYTTSNGSATVNNSILWAVDDVASGQYPYPIVQPALANIFSNTGAPTGLSTVSTTIASQPFSPGQTTYSYEYWTYTYQPVTIAPNSSADFLFFTAQEATPATAATAAQRLVQLPPEALTGLSSSDLANVVNFAIPTTQTLNAPTPPPANVLSGHVYAGDGVTPIPSAIVAATSTDLLFGFGASAIADATGSYNIPAFLANSYVAYAVDPRTNVTSPSVSGTYPSNPQNMTEARTQDIPFTNTGIIQGLVQSTGQGTFTGGLIYDNFPYNQATGYSSASTTFGPSGQFTFLTALAGTNSIQASVTTPQGGTIQIPPNYAYLLFNIPAKQTTQVVFTVPPTGNIAGTVSNADGTPAIGVTVTASPASSGTYETTTTNSAGAYAFTSVALDMYTISATDPITGGTVSQKTTTTQDTTSTVNLTFIGKGTVVVTAMYANGNIASNVQLTLSTSTTPAFTYASSLTNGSGQYTFSNVPTGAYIIRAYYPGQGFYSITNGSITGTGNTVQQAVTLTPVGTIQGNVAYANGTPGANAYVFATDAQGIFLTNGSTDSAGNYAFFPVPADRLIKVYSYSPQNTGNPTIEAVANNQQVPGDGQTLTVNLRYPGTANVHVALLNADGSPYQNNGGYSTNGVVYLNSSDGLQTYTANLGSDGTATFSNVAEASFTAYARIAYNSYAFGSTTFTVTPAEDGTTVNVTITATPSGTVQGTVFASDGVTAITNNYSLVMVDNATGLKNYDSPGTAGYSFTGVEAGSGGFSLTASVNNTPASSAVTQTGNITSQGRVVTLNFTLPVSSISGQVFLNDGVTPVPYANVYAVQTVDGTTTDWYYINVDGNGNYQLSGPVAGPVTIYATDANGVIGSTTVNLTSNTQIVSGANINLGPVGMVIGTVYDQNNLVVPNTTVYLQSSGNNGGFYSQFSTDQNGNYTAADIPIGNITITVDLSNNTQVQATGTLVNPGDTITINIGTPPAVNTGTVFGTVYDNNNNPDPNATVTATDSGNNVFTATTDQNGMYTVSGLATGMVTVSAVLDDGVTQVGPVVGDLINASTPVEIDLNLQNSGDVSGVVYDVNGNPIPNVGILLGDSNVQNSLSYETTGNDGSFDFGGNPQGTITLTVYDNNGNTIGTATGVLPYGGNLVLNVTTNTVGASLTRPQLRPAKRPPNVVAAARGILASTIVASQRSIVLAPPLLAAPEMLIPHGGQQ